jgi:hypothetical protein
VVAERARNRHGSLAVDWSQTHVSAEARCDRRPVGGEAARRRCRSGREPVLGAGDRAPPQVAFAECRRSCRGFAIETAGPGLPEGLLDIYKLAVEMADRISARRAAASSFFLAAQTALVALVGATSKRHWAFAVPGLVLAATWWLLLRSYRHLNAEKFKVIQAMEKRLPASPFQDEWDALKPTSTGRLRERYVELGLLERIVPALFGAIFIAILVTS